MNRTKGMFKNVPNLELRGSTYDVRHLDKFIQYDNRKQAFLSSLPGSTADQTNG